MIVGIVGAVLAGIGMIALTFPLVVIDGPGLSAQTMAVLMLTLALGVMLDATWLTFAVARVWNLDDDSEDEDGEGWGRWRGSGPHPGPPPPPGEDPPWWPEFERDFRAHVKTRDDARVPA